MGREIRMVPENWKHPEKTEWNALKGRMITSPQPMFYEDYEKAAKEWLEDCQKYYTDGRKEKYNEHYWDYAGAPPDKKYYIPYDKETATWVQLYETVSEGTPVTPAFATKQELADYLAVNGDYWDQERREEGNSIMNCEPWGKEAAEKFVFGSGYMPSMIFSNGKVITGGDLAKI